MRQSIEKLIRLGRFPSYAEGTSETSIEQYQALIEEIIAPIDDEEAKSLCLLLGADDFFGLAWTVIHLVETAPNWPLNDVINKVNPPWREVLMQRVENTS